MPTQKAVIVEKYGAMGSDPASGIKTVDDWPIPEPGKGEVRVRIRLRPVNPADVFSITGVYPGFVPKSLPAVPGLEGVGVVDKNGEGANKFQPGQRVVASMWQSRKGQGTYQQYTIADEACLLAVSDNVSDESAAQFLVNPVTVFGFIDVLGAPAGEYILSNAANSVLGRQLIQLCKAKGIKTINLVRRREHFNELKALGADEVICSTEEDIVARVMEITDGKGAYGGADPVGGDVTAKLTSSLRDGGTLLMYSMMADTCAKVNIVDLLFRGVVVKGFWLGPWLMSKGDGASAILQDILKALEDGTITPYAGTRYPLDQFKEAVAATNKPGRGGKVFLEG